MQMWSTVLQWLPLSRGVRVTNNVVLLQLHGLIYHCVKDIFGHFHRTQKQDESWGVVFCTIFILVEHHGPRSETMCKFMRLSMAAVSILVKAWKVGTSLIILMLILE